MAENTFLLIIILTQACFLIIDFISVYRSPDNSPNPAEKIRFESILFLILVALIYGGIQFGTLALLPKTEILLDWTKGFLPNVAQIERNVPLIIWVMVGILVFYIASFWDYVAHRYLSHHKKLFFTHEYHHLPNKMFLVLPGLSVRPFVAIAAFPATIATIICVMFLLNLFGLRDLNLMPLVYVILLIQSIILAITHSDFFLKYWFIYHAFKFLSITSPQEHEIHHTVDIRGNYGNFSLLWDRLFGTYVDPRKIENQNHQLGLPAKWDRDFLGAITGGKLKLSESMRKKFQIAKYCNLKED